jgi:hypothetical protein
VFRLMKRRSIGFSFAYMIIDAVKRIDGIREIRQLDVFAVTATPTPMNNGPGCSPQRRSTTTPPSGHEHATRCSSC